MNRKRQLDGRKRTATWLRLTVMIVGMLALLLVPTMSMAAVDLGPIVNPANGHTYYRIGENTWTGAEAEAVSMGGHLVTINDAAENTWVWQTFGWTWIGLNDAASEGTFVWSSGESSTFTSWWNTNGGNEPNGGVVENYVEMNNAVWNDTNSTAQFKGVVEIGPSTPPAPNPLDNWFVRNANQGGFEALTSWSTMWGNTGDIPLVGNFNGGFDEDDIDDIAVYRPSTAGWYVNRSTGAAFDGTGWNTIWGNVGTDKPLVGDFNGGGDSDIAIHRAGSHPNWFFKLSEGDGFATETVSLSWGNANGDLPILGYFNDDSKVDIGIYRAGAHPNWFVRLNTSTGGIVSWDDPVAWSLSWGNASGDLPIVGDFNGDDIDDIGIYRTNSYPNWFFLPTASDGSGFMAPQNAWFLNWGNLGTDRPLVGYFNADGSSDIGIFRVGSYPNWITNNSTGTGFDQQSDTLSSWGKFTDQPIIGNFNGDASSDLGIYRP